MNLEQIMDDAFPEHRDANMSRARPYIGQPHTDHGERGRTEICGVTFRDLRDCFIRAAFMSAHHVAPHHYEQSLKGEDACLCEADLYELDWNALDPGAVARNLSNEIERLMGIFPNVPTLEGDGPKQAQPREDDV